MVWGFFTNHKTELFEEKESLTTLNVNAPILCIQFTELNYAAYWNTDKCFYQKATSVNMSAVDGLQSIWFEALGCSISTALLSQMLYRGIMSKILSECFFFLTIAIYLQLWKPLYQTLRSRFHYKSHRLLCWWCQLIHWNFKVTTKFYLFFCNTLCSSRMT